VRRGAGYYVQRPQPPEVLSAWLATRELIAYDTAA
jgi:hypothetical protein